MAVNPFSSGLKSLSSIFLFHFAKAKFVRVYTRRMLKFRLYTRHNISKRMQSRMLGVRASEIACEIIVPVQKQWQRAIV